MRALTFIVLLLLSPTARADTDPRQAAASAVAGLLRAELRARMREGLQFLNGVASLGSALTRNAR